MIGPCPEPPDFSKVFCDLLTPQTGCFGLIGLGEPLLIPTLIGLSGAVREEEVEIGGNRLLLFKVTCDLSSLVSHMVGREREVGSRTVGGLASCAVGREEGVGLHMVGKAEGVGLHTVGREEGVGLHTVGREEGVGLHTVGREEGVGLHMMGREEGVGLHTVGREEGVAAVGVGVLDKDIHIIT